MWATVEGIRTSTLFFILSYALIACAQGTEISPSEIVVIEPLTPRDAPDASAGADASAGPSASAGTSAGVIAPADPEPESASGE